MDTGTEYKKGVMVSIPATISLIKAFFRLGLAQKYLHPAKRDALIWYKNSGARKMIPYFFVNP